MIKEMMEDEWIKEHAVVLEHKEWLKEDETQAMMTRVVEFLTKRSIEYEKMREYKGDDPSEHVFKEFTDIVHKELTK